MGEVMKFHGILAALLLIASPAFATNPPVLQTGVVTPGHPVMWTTTGIVQDAGTSANGGLTTLGITANSQQSLCIHSGPTTAAYAAFCFGVTPSGAYLSLTGYNGLTNLPLNLILNGAPQTWPLNTLPLTGGTLSVEPAESYIGLTPFLVTKPFVKDSAQFFSQMNTSVSGGTTGDVVSNGRFSTSILGAPNEFIWSLLGILDYFGTGGTGQHVAVYGQGNRRTFAAGGSANNPQIWGGVFAANDMTGQASSATNALLGVEIDLAANGLDDANVRSGMVMVLSRQNPAGAHVVANTGISFSAQSVSDSFNTILNLAAPFNTTAIDLRTSQKNSGHTVWMATGGDLAFDNAGSNTIFYDATAITGAGAIRFPGNVEIDGTKMFLPNASLTIGNNAVFAANGGLGFSNQTNGAGFGAGTLTNAPTAGDPAFWLSVNINGVTRHIPAW